MTHADMDRRIAEALHDLIKELRQRIAELEAECDRLREALDKAVPMLCVGPNQKIFNKQLAAANKKWTDAVNQCTKALEQRDDANERVATQETSALEIAAMLREVEAERDTAIAERDAANSIIDGDCITVAEAEGVVDSCCPVGASTPEQSAGYRTAQDDIKAAIRKLGEVEDD
jgi:DNA repair exonuclease SbcCD ATPase subunit